jgi:hypothetical protein
MELERKSMKTKTFFVSDSGLISRHKIRKTNIVGMGILNPDQTIVVYTKDLNKYSFNYEELKISLPHPKPLVVLSEGDLITKIDISTNIDPS